MGFLDTGFGQLIAKPFVNVYDQIKETLSGEQIPEQGKYPVDAPYAKDEKIYEGLSLYNTTPYGFSYSTGDQTYRFWLPINPSNLTITTQFANNIIPTLYGVIEERSEIKIYNISISGTTGVAPKYPRMQSPEGKAGSSHASAGRRDGVGALTKGVNSVAELDPTGFVKKAGGQLMEAAGSLTTSIFGPSAPSGLKNYNSGYAAFHNFYKYLWTYQKLVGTKAQDLSGSASVKARNIKLNFLNYKDQCVYTVSPQRFSMVRSSDSPYLYNYSIELVGYSLQEMKSETSKEFSISYGDRVKQLGLDGVRSSTLKGTAAGVMGSINNLRSIF